MSILDQGIVEKASKQIDDFDQIFKDGASRIFSLVPKKQQQFDRNNRFMRQSNNDSAELVILFLFEGWQEELSQYGADIKSISTSRFIYQEFISGVKKPDIYQFLRKLYRDRYIETGKTLQVILAYKDDDWIYRQNSVQKGIVSMKNSK